MSVSYIDTLAPFCFKKDNIHEVALTLESLVTNDLGKYGITPIEMVVNTANAHQRSLSLFVCLERPISMTNRQLIRHGSYQSVFPPEAPMRSFHRFCLGNIFGFTGTIAS